VAVIISMFLELQMSSDEF